MGSVHLTCKELLLLPQRVSTVPNPSMSMYEGSCMHGVTKAAVPQRQAGSQEVPSVQEQTWHTDSSSLSASSAAKLRTDVRR